MHRNVFMPLLVAALAAAACTQSKPDCQGTAQACGGSCVEFKSDNLNCGACGAACSAGQVCSNGTCTVTCAAGLVNCGGHCIDPTTDRAHCGASGACTGGTAGAACVDGQLCSAGQCVQTCSDSQSACPAASPTYCADLTRDANNCGTCGASCAAGQQCVTTGGTAACACPPATPTACGSGASAFCTSTATDPSNCGGCGTVCGAGTVCSGGQCVQSCSAAATACPAVNPTYCANTASDANNCGGCGTVCPAGQQCSAGQCTCPAATPDACATGGGLAFCTNAATDSLNCGSCGHACGAGEVCVSGACVTSCPSGEYACAGKCIDPMSDQNYCGARSDCTGGAACGPGESCYQAKCEPLCPAGQVMCQGSCIDPQTDHTFCGASAYCVGAAAGVTCLPTQTCVGGLCVPPPCTWSPLASSSLAVQPPSSVTCNGALGGQNATNVYGRDAWYQTSDWNQLFLASGTGPSDDAVAGEVDFYSPSAPAFSRVANFVIEADNTSCSGVWGTTGVAASIEVSASGTSAVLFQSPSTELARTPVASVVGAWHRLRVEAVKSSCRMRLLLDDVQVLSAQPPTCSLSGSMVIVGSGTRPLGNNSNIAFTNYKTYSGAGGSCVP